VWYEFRLHNLFLSLGILMFIMCFVVTLMFRMTGVVARLTFMCCNYMGFFLMRVILFLILRRFTPTFTIKSVIKGDFVEMIAVNQNEHEVFRYKILK
jgi:hypothetical protein